MQADRSKGFRLTFLFFLFWALLLISSPAAAEQTRIFSIGAGFENYSYRETSDELNLSSKSDSENISGTASFAMDFRKYLLEINAAFPLAVNADEEYWTRNAVLQQKNRLSWRWYRVEGLIGYRVKNWLSPFTGLRWSESEYRRNGFIVNGQPVEGMAAETVRTFEIPVGICGDITVWGPVTASFRIAVYIPFYTTVDNSNYPAVTFRDIVTETLHASGGIRYEVSDTICIGLQVTGETIEREASGWEKTGSGTDVKYPDNETRYFSAMITGFRRF